jgi:hypothetical protein
MSLDPTDRHAAHGRARDDAAVLSWSTPADGVGPDGAPALDGLLRRVVACARAGAEAGEGAPRTAAWEAPVRGALASACARARADGLRAEHVLVRLKDAWTHTPGAPGAVLVTRPGAPDTLRLPTRGADGPDDHDRLARVVTLCIEEFYRGDGSRDGARDGGSADPLQRAEEGPLA